MSRALIDQVKEQFRSLSNRLFADLSSSEKLNLSLHAEDSLFCRFNGAKTRQKTDVQQIELNMELFIGQRHADMSFQLSGQLDQDTKKSRIVLNELRQICGLIPEDPFAVMPADNGQSEESHPGLLLQPSQMVEAVLHAAKDTDFVGIYQAGPLASGAANSEGQFHWFDTDNFALDYSLFAKNENAVKACYAGPRWQEMDWQSNFNQALAHLEKMNLPSRKIPRGKYRTYLAPAAVEELLDTLGWGGLSYRSLKMGDCGLKSLFEGQKQLSPKISLKENFSMGMTPRFNNLGEVAPLQLDLIREGRANHPLISSKSAKEYSVEGNFATPGENPRALDMAPGGLDKQEILSQIGEGLFLSNLHYLNWSDRPSARITGMTRYACFWVEGGELVSPIEDLRFDISLYDAWGENLVDLTSDTETHVNLDTYDRRHLGGRRKPGMLIEDFQFTL